MVNPINKATSLQMSNINLTLNKVPHVKVTASVVAGKLLTSFDKSQRQKNALASQSITSSSQRLFSTSSPGNQLGKPSMVLSHALTRDVMGKALGLRMLSTAGSKSGANSMYTKALIDITDRKVGLVEVARSGQTTLPQFVDSLLKIGGAVSGCKLANGYTIFSLTEAPNNLPNGLRMDVKRGDIKHYKMLVTPPSHSGLVSGTRTIPLTVIKTPEGIDPKSENGRSVIQGLAKRAIRSHREQTLNPNSTPKVISQDMNDLEATLQQQAKSEVIVQTIFGQVTRSEEPQLDCTYFPMKQPGDTGVEAINAMLQGNFISSPPIAKTLLLLATDGKANLKLDPAEPDSGLSSSDVTTILNLLLNTNHSGDAPQTESTSVELRDIGHRGGATRAAIKLNAFADGLGGRHYPVICVARQPLDGQVQQSSKSATQMFAIFRDSKGQWVEQVPGVSDGVGSGKLFANRSNLAEALKARQVTQIISQPLGFL